MAAVVDMGEVDEIVHSNAESIKGGSNINNDSYNFKEDVVLIDSNDVENVPDTIQMNDEVIVSPSIEMDDAVIVEDEELVNHTEYSEEKTENNDIGNVLELDDTDSNKNEASEVDDTELVDNEVEHIDDDDVTETTHLTNGVLEEKILVEIDSTTAKHDSVIETDNDDVLVIDPIENGSIDSNTNDSVSNRSTPSIESQSNGTTNMKKYKKNLIKDALPRRSLRKTKDQSYLDRNEEHFVKKSDESESDIEEILPEDPLAVADVPLAKKTSSASPTIIVKDTKSLADIASISVSSNNKTEPTLVIIDTNSILSGRGPVPVAHKQSQAVSNSYPILPMALPAQGLYPPNMRATITPIPISTASVTKVGGSSQPHTKATTLQVSSPPVLPTLTDDMYVVEAPSFIVPYVYEKPPVVDLKDLVKSFDILKNAKKVNDGKSEKGAEEKRVIEEDEEGDGKEKPIDVDKLPSMDPVSSATLAAELKKPPTTYFDSPLGKFFMNIGSSLVQEVVQNDLLKQQKRKRDREGGANVETLKTISSLLKNLEFTKENNEPFHMEVKKCEFCSFKTESALTMAFHLETPHMKNFVYRCNFCVYEVRSPHDILYHMEYQHGIRGRLERAPAFHQCPNCPFEDNQKGKLSRHLVTCARKFKPERNLEPPVDYEPPAKIPRAPRMKQQGLGSAAAVYQAMARSPQFQMFTKTPSPTSVNAINRNRGRPTLPNVPSVKPSNVRSPSGMIFKSTSMSGGSVLLPSNYQVSGNQVYQVAGGPEMGCRMGLGGTTGFLSSISGTSNCMSIQGQQQSQQNPTSKVKTPQSHPSISITPLPRGTTAAATTKPGDSNSKSSFVICEICDGYIKDLEQLRNHMQWIHKVKIHPRMIYNRPPLNCQKCQFRFFTDQGLERHLLGSHGLVTSSMQEAANKSKDSGRCPVCGRVYQWKLLNHVARDHGMTLKPAHLSYKCTVCTATFGMYKQFESHVYSAHGGGAKRAIDKKTINSSAASSINKNDSILKPLKINDEITIIPQPAKSNSEEAMPSTSNTSITIRNSVGQSNGSTDIHDIDSGTSVSREKRRKISPNHN